MIDLHLHTTASDGRLSPEQLVAEASRAGLTTIAVTDHDTVAATAAVMAACAARGMDAVAGVEITAIEHRRDVHVLGYLFDPANVSLLAFLARQRAYRIDRVTAIAERLASLGMPIDAGPLLAAATSNTGQSIGRPQVAQAMLDAGYAATRDEVFERWLGDGKPAFVPRPSLPVADVIGMIHGAGGVASLAHPGETRVDDAIPRMRDAGLDAIEVYHSDHSPADRERYLRMAAELGLLVTGGSDFHANPEHGIVLGSVSLPRDAWETLKTWPRRS